MRCHQLFRYFRSSSNFLCITANHSKSFATAIPNCVFWLTSNDIFRNLSFESTLFDNKHRYMVLPEPNSEIHQRRADVIMWKSNPCVVIGRHQNPWLEANQRELENRGWSLVRRMSGGGTVFHDLGNLNVSFIESRSTMERQKCMQFLQNVLTQRWPFLNVFIGPRFDLWVLPTDMQTDIKNTSVPIEASKFSGAASRFSATVGLHHCTLLFSANMTHLHNVLSSSLSSIETRASKSVPARVTNICVNGDELIAAISDACNNWLVTGNDKLITVCPGEEKNWVDERLFEDNLKKFTSWEWIYGSTPKFSIPICQGSFHVECDKGKFVRIYNKDECTNQLISTWLESLSSVLHDQPCAHNAWNDIIFEFQHSHITSHTSDLQSNILTELIKICSKF